jgi:DNA-binding CsgD family transcriptional regulator
MKARRLRRSSGLAFVVVSLALFALLFAPRVPGAAGLARAGELDASGARGDVLPLTGEWSLLGSVGGVEGASRYAALPRTWARPIGSATYGLTIVGLDPSVEYSLRMPYLRTSYCLSGNGLELFHNGVAGLSRAESIPAYAPGIARLSRGASRLYLTLRVSNYSHFEQGGPFQAILIGESSRIARFDFWRIFSDASIVVLCVAMGAMFILNAVMRRNSATFFVGLFLVHMGTVLFCNFSELLVLRAFPGLPWKLHNRLTYALAYTLPIWAFLAARSLFAKRPRAIAAIAILSPLGAFLVLFAAAPPELFMRLNLVYQTYTLLVCALSIAMGLGAVFRKEPYARIFTAGFFLYAAATLTVMFFHNGKFYGREYLSLVSLFYAGLIVMLNLFAATLLFRKERAPSIAAVPGDGKLAGRALTEKASAAGLSTREIEVLRLVLEGKRNREICDELHISLSTVKTHLSHIFSKTEVSSRGGLFSLFKF